mmetsp:Transcript_37874/g.93758  ORF Transcript_37874/g.93758 Transcript_37874/m.93758 type:complete len:84 (+) Transcript_37874:172-423(+)
MGIAPDQPKAAQMYKHAADQGLATAQYSLGYCCMLGIGVAHDVVAAACYLRLAADQGHVAAAYNVSLHSSLFASLSPTVSTRT